MKPLNDRLFTEAIRDPLWKHIYLTPQLFDITHSTDFVRLWRIKQLGPTDFVYPGAVHTRASHSYGVYFIAFKLLKRLIEQDATWITESGCFSFLCAALLHDLGHFPYTHSLKELPLLEHEELTALLILKEPLRTLVEKTGANAQQVAAIVDVNIETTDSETLFYRKLLSGVLDPDKIDYLNRDAYFCGVPYGIQDTDFILARVLPDKQRGIVLDSNSILAVENVLFSKYLMYRAVYWHKTVRTATAMMKKSIFTSLQNGIISAEELYNLDDASLFSLLHAKKHDAHTIAFEVEKRNTFDIIHEVQFDKTSIKHIELENTENRSKIEKQIADECKISFYHILIDIPERISFESDLWIADENCIFSKSTTAFKAETVQALTDSLRKIRVAVHPSLSEQKRKEVVAIFSKM